MGLLGKALRLSRKAMPLLAMSRGSSATNNEIKVSPDGLLRPPNAVLVRGAERGLFDYDVVGESHYIANLRQILKDEGLDLEEGGEWVGLALLLCEPENAADPNAIAVTVNAKKVGHIPAEDAQGLAPQLMALVEKGQLFCVGARIGWRDSEIIGVRLDLEST